MILRRGSSITTNATGTDPGGNITINTDNLVAVPQENSDISANATESSGGRVSINAQGIFGIQFRQKDTLLSDITATSALGPQFSGTVQINTLVNNPSQGLVNLPVKPVDVVGQIAQGCPAGVGPRSSRFVVTGRGGLPPDPTEALRSEPTLADLGTTVQRRDHPASAAPLNNPVSSKPAPLVEAQGWVTNAKGEVVLVAQAPTVTPHIPWLSPNICHTF
ncbi:MAG: S-layer family protein [Chroococcidiopsidaceae cyanobacterium CP_BM_RX_35]|nr:S-layer family protein [Chroococcidiopsidaceae cyanobacterium CP_BM_RX_35]